MNNKEMETFQAHLYMPQATSFFPTHPTNALNRSQEPQITTRPRGQSRVSRDGVRANKWGIIGTAHRRRKQKWGYTASSGVENYTSYDNKMGNNTCFGKVIQMAKGLTC